MNRAWDWESGDSWPCHWLTVQPGSSHLNALRFPHLQSGVMVLTLQGFWLITPCRSAPGQWVSAWSTITCGRSRNAMTTSHSRLASEERSMSSTLEPRAWNILRLRLVNIISQRGSLPRPVPCFRDFNFNTLHHKSHEMEGLPVGRILGGCRPTDTCCIESAAHCPATRKSSHLSVELGGHFSRKYFSLENTDRNQNFVGKGRFGSMSQFEKLGGREFQNDWNVLFWHFFNWKLLVSVWNDFLDRNKS